MHLVPCLRFKVGIHTCAYIYIHMDIYIYSVDLWEVHVTAVELRGDSQHLEGALSDVALSENAPALAKRLDTSLSLVTSAGWI